MDKIKVVGGNPLFGKVYISGAKNTALPIICASLLTDEAVTVKNLPILSDIKSLNGLLLQLGTQIEGRQEMLNGHITQTFTYYTPKPTSLIAPYDYVRKMRASYYVLGPLLTKYRHVELSLPGGCAIGARPMDIHLSSLEQMGAKIEIKNGYVIADVAERLHGTRITFPLASVGATCNILMAAVLAEGTTIIENAAKEPEIADLIAMLNGMGAQIEGADTSTLVIKGVDKLHGTTHLIINDRIEAGSYAVAAAITKGRLELVNARAEHLQCPLSILRKCGAKVEETANGIIVDAQNEILHGEDIYTDYYPGFPTDLQAQFMALMCVSEGAAMVTESIWENRFMHVPELMRMGANINIHGHASAIVRGVKKLSSAPVMSTDLRASFALILAGLVAEGETIVNRVYHLDRGYEHLEEKFKQVGANIERLKEAD
jgi:UDP-N-acetylglucosamine 1-carboxyvinyltransferase